MKSGCFFCPFQRKSEVVRLRKERPELFCVAETMENISAERRKLAGKNPLYLYDFPIRAIVNEAQGKLFEIDEYPPCNCML